MDNGSSSKHQNHNVPKLRFPGFEGEWSTATLGELGTFTKGASLSKADISEDGTPFILYGELYTTYDEVTEKIVRKTNQSASAEQYSKIGDVIIPTSGETPEEIATATCVMVSDVILAGDLNIYRTDTVDGRLISYIINHIVNKDISKVAQGKSVVHIKADELSKIHIRYPDKSEQDKIITFWGVLSNRISKQRELVEKLKTYKRGVLEGIFACKYLSSDNSKWKKYVLSDITIRVTRKNNGTTNVPLTISSQYGLVEQRQFFSKVVASKDLSNYYLLNRGEFAYNRSASSESPVGAVKRLEKYDNGAVSTLYLCFAVNESQINAEMLKYYFESSLWHQHIKSICSEGARNHGLLNVPTKEFFDLELYLPESLETQRRIVTVLKGLQDIVDNENRHLEALYTLKNGLLTQMFI